MHGLKIVGRAVLEALEYVAEQPAVKSVEARAVEVGAEAIANRLPPDFHDLAAPMLRQAADLLEAKIRTTGPEDGK